LGTEPRRIAIGNLGASGDDLLNVERSKLRTKHYVFLDVRPARQNVVTEVSITSEDASQQVARILNRAACVVSAQTQRHLPRGSIPDLVSIMSFLDGHLQSRTRSGPNMGLF
jgi:hypothetical protein